MRALDWIGNACAGIAIVSLCRYNGTVTELSSLSADNKLRYSLRHSYELFFHGDSLNSERPVAWSKVSVDVCGACQGLAGVSEHVLLTHLGVHTASRNEYTPPHSGLAHVDGL